MKIIVALVLFVCAFVAKAQDTTKIVGSDSVNLEKDFSKTLYVVDGIKIKADDKTGKTWGDVLNIPSENITSITVLKGEEAFAKYGEEGKFGVILIETKQAQSSQPLYFVNGVERKTVEDIEPSNIVSINVLKNKEETQKYGSRGKNGVILITTKK
jgi:TonB-dependent SusC/RagA subfamily outer membrane receptor